MTYPEAKAKRDALETATKEASKRLATFPRFGVLGLVTETVRTSPEYCAASLAYRQAFAALRDFNGSFVKSFARELREERAARQAARIGKAP